MNGGTPVSFDGNDMQTMNIITQTIAHEASPNKTATPSEVSHSNRNVIPYINYPSRLIPASGHLLPTTPGSIAETDAIIDTFKGFFNAKDANLDIGYAGGTRRYIGTATTDPIITRPRGLASASWALVFTCQPFGQDVTQTTLLSATGRTGSVYVDTFVVTGTAPIQLPVITVVYSALTGSGAKSVMVGNSLNGQQITVTRTWMAGDSLVIDATRPSNPVTVNGIPIDYTGAFPEFVSGTQGTVYSDTFSSRTFAMSVTYNRRWK